MGQALSAVPEAAGRKRRRCSRVWDVFGQVMDSGKPVHISTQWEEEEDLAEFVYRCQLRTNAITQEESWPDIREFWLAECGRNKRNLPASTDEDCREANCGLSVSFFFHSEFSFSFVFFFVFFETPRLRSQIFIIFHKFSSKMGSFHMRSAPQFHEISSKSVKFQRRNVPQVHQI